MKNDFNDFRFKDLNYKQCSNHYFTMDRVSEDEKKIVVKVGDNHLLSTLYGYALILDNTHVVFLKKWQVSKNDFGNEVLLNKEFWKVTEWGLHEDFDTNEKNYDFNTWLEIAKEQAAFVDDEGIRNLVKWRIKDRRDDEYAY